MTLSALACVILTAARDDFCCLGPDGGLECWENTAGKDPRSPTWIAMGVVKESEGYPQAQVYQLTQALDVFSH